MAHTLRNVLKRAAGLNACERRITQYARCRTLEEAAQRLNAADIWWVLEHLFVWGNPPLPRRHLRLVLQQVTWGPQAVAILRNYCDQLNLTVPLCLLLLKQVRSVGDCRALLYAYPELSLNVQQAMRIWMMRAARAERAKEARDGA